MYNLLWLSFFALCSFAGRSPFWPEPAHAKLGNQTLSLERSILVTILADGHPDHYTWRTPNGDPHKRRIDRFRHILNYAQSITQGVIWKYVPFLTSPTRVEEVFSEELIVRMAVDRTLAAINDLSFIPWKFYPRTSNYEPQVISDWKKEDIYSMTITQTNYPSKTFSSTKFFDEDESYELYSVQGRAYIKSHSTTGTLRALETFKQLFYAHSTSERSYTTHAPFHIVDRPRWRHRGLSLDIARNPFTLESVKKTIDGLAAAKLNRLHLHATDSQSWPFEIPTLPDLAVKGAYQPHLVWSAQDLEDLQRYGASRGVMVFVELDMPGHTASIAHAYPELIAAFNELDWSTFAAEPLSGQLKLDSEEVYAFLDKLFDNLLPRLKPYSTCYHFGGDELNKQVHLLDNTVWSNETSVLKPLVQKILDRVLEHVRGHKMKPIVWEEMVLDWNLEMPKISEGEQELLVQVWRDPKRIEEVLEKGHSVIFGDYRHWYLDCGFGQFLDPYPSGSSPPGVPVNTTGGRPSQLDAQYLDYCQPYHNWRSVYTFNPLDGVSDHLHGGIEGGEVLMWSEQTDSIDLDFKLWPRTAAAAEVLWSGPRRRGQIADATWRLGQLRERLVLEHGIQSSPVTMTWCLMEGGCEL